MLRGYRAIDITDEKGAFCGKMLGDLGVDVIKVEKPGGDLLRHRGPFSHDTPDPEKSLPWFAYHSNKRGITLDIEKPAGHALFNKLVKTANFMIASLPPGDIERLGLDYDSVKSLNSSIVVTTITPFGLTGPYRDYKDGDLIVMATGGMMSMTGEPDGPPLRLNPDHAYYIASYNALIGTLIANYSRGVTGKGQMVDVSINDSVIREFYYPIPVYEFENYVPKRIGDKGVRAGKVFRQRFKCKDGFVTWFMHGGLVGSSTNIAISRWADELGIPDGAGVKEWENFDIWHASQDVLDKVMDRFAELVARFTKSELRQEFVKRDIRAAIIDDIQDVYENLQLRHKNFWVDIEHPDLGESIPYPGDLFYSNELRTCIRRRAPRIGEHNQEVYQHEFGLSTEEMESLQKQRVI